MLELLKYLKLKEVFIQEVIVCRSETPVFKASSIQKRYGRQAEKIRLKPRVIVSSVPFRAYDGTNRNRGMKLASADYIVFLDADDLYAECMFDIISNIFISTDCDAVLHNYTFDTSDFKEIDEYRVKTLELEYPDSAALLDFQKPIRIKNSSELPKLHHAHLSMKKGAFLEEFLDIFPGADTEYCKRVIRSGKRVVYIDEKLSFWNRKRSFRYKIRLVRNKLRLKSRFHSQNQ